MYTVEYQTEVVKMMTLQKSDQSVRRPWLSHCSHAPNPLSTCFGQQFPTYPLEDDSRDEAMTSQEPPIGNCEDQG